MNKKIKFLSSTLSALLITSCMALTNVHAQSALTGDVASPTKTSSTISGSNKGYNYSISEDVYHNITVNMSPTDYENHHYKVDVHFYDKNKGIIDSLSVAKYGLTYTQVFASQKTWVTAEVWTYVTNSGGTYNLISDTVVNY